MNVQRKTRFGAILAMVFGVGTCASVASAQIESGDSVAVIEEIVVTATKREQSLTDVPVSVVAYSEDHLQSLKVSNIRELQRISPSLGWATTSQGLGGSLYVRGVGTFVSTIALEQSAGITIDGVPIGRVLGTLSDWVDIERLEVLRGPQGTLFGKNATAGLLQVVTNDPGYETEFTGTAHYGRFDEQRLQLTANLPIVDGVLAARLSAWSFERDGFVLQPLAGEGGNSLNSRGARAKLLWEPAEDLSFLLTAEVVDSDTTCCTWVYSRNTPGTSSNDSSAAVGIVASKENRTVGSNYSATTDADSSAYSLFVNYDLGDFLLTSLSAYREYDSNDNFDADFSPAIITPLVTSGGPTDQFTQEFRLTSTTGDLVDFVAGLFYYTLDAESLEDQRFDFGPLLGIPVRIPLARAALSVISTESMAAFAEGTWNLSEKFRAITGFRASRDKTSGTFSRTIPAGYGPLTAPFTFSTETDYSGFAWRAGIQYYLTENTMTYITGSTGYKGPGFSFSNDLTPEQVAFNSAAVGAETVLTYEVGFKGNWFDNRLSLSAATYHSTFQDLQTTAFLDASSALLSIGIVNVPEAVAKGMEMEVTARPLEGLTLSASLAYTDAKNTDFPNGPCYSAQTPAQGCIGGMQSLNGKTLPFAPTWAGFAHIRYERALGFIPATAYVQPSYYYRSPVQSEPNQTPFSMGDSINMLNVALGVVTNNGHWEFALIGKNILDSHFLGRLNQGVFAPAQETIHFPSIESLELWGLQVKFSY